MGAITLLIQGIALRHGRYPREGLKGGQAQPRKEDKPGGNGIKEYKEVYRLGKER